jgi:hypothetical protein
MVLSPAFTRACGGYELCQNRSNVLKCLYVKLKKGQKLFPSWQSANSFHLSSLGSLLVLSDNSHTVSRGILSVEIQCIHKKKFVGLL